MARGLCVAIGLNHVDTSSSAYQGADIPTLHGCVNDANSVADMVRQLPSYDLPIVMPDAQATHDAVLAQIQAAAHKLQPGDLFLLHYSGHGMQGSITNGNADQDSKENSSWILWDRPLSSDELYQQWSVFQQGVRVLIFSDSCFSGAAIRGVNPPPFRERGLDSLTRLRVLTNNFSYFQVRAGVQSFLKSTAQTPTAAIVLFSGCQQDQTSLDTLDQNNVPHGLFTASLVKVWNNGSFTDNYLRFFNQVAQETNAQSQKIASGHLQEPNFFPVGSPMHVGMFVQLSPPFKV